MGINLHEHGWDEVQAANPGEFVPLPADGYICKIINAEMTQSRNQNPMLNLHVDIDEGEFAGYFKKSFESVKKFKPDAKWDSNGIYRQVIYDSTNKVTRFFKGLITTIMRCNPNNNINSHDFEAASLRGLLIGLVFGQEEYTKNNGDIGIKTVPRLPTSLAKIHDRDFKIPELKKLKDQTPPPSTSDNGLEGKPVGNDDIPF